MGDNILSRVKKPFPRLNSVDYQIGDNSWPYPANRLYTEFRRFAENGHNYGEDDQYHNMLKCGGDRPVAPTLPRSIIWKKQVRASRDLTDFDW